MIRSLPGGDGGMGTHLGRKEHEQRHGSKKVHGAGKEPWESTATFRARVDYYELELLSTIISLISVLAERSCYLISYKLLLTSSW